MAELLHELFAIEADFTPDFPVQTRGLELLLGKDCAEIFVAETKGQVVGMCTIQILISTAMGCEVGKIEDVVVTLRYRAKGIGSAVLQKAEEWAAGRGLARLQLQADRDNHPSLGFYRRQGWHHTNQNGWMKHL